jgi:hypothetical protein
MCISITLILLMIGALVSLYFINIKTNKETLQKDMEFNIARAVCEKFKYETLNPPEKNVIVYINDFSEIPDNITNILINQPNVEDLSYSFILSKNSNSKKFALILKTSKQMGLDILKVNVLSMDGSFIETNLKVTKSSGEAAYE